MRDSRAYLWMEQNFTVSMDNVKSGRVLEIFCFWLQTDVANVFRYLDGRYWRAVSHNPICNTCCSMVLHTSSWLNLSSPCWVTDSFWFYTWEVNLSSDLFGHLTDQSRQVALFPAWQVYSGTKISLTMHPTVPVVCPIGQYHWGWSLRQCSTGAIYAILSYFACREPFVKFMLFAIVPIPAWSFIPGMLLYDVYNIVASRGVCNFLMFRLVHIVWAHEFSFENHRLLVQIRLVTSAEYLPAWHTFCLDELVSACRSISRRSHMHRGLISHILVYGKVWSHLLAVAFNCKGIHLPSIIKASSATPHSTHRSQESNYCGGKSKEWL